MANTAIIDFLFNSQGAMKGISEFQEKLSKSVDAIVNSTTGKLGAIGTTILGFASMKSMFQEVQKFADFSTMYDKPVEDISRFNNVMAHFGASTEDTLSTLGQMEDALTELRTNASGAYKSLAARLKIDFIDSTTGRFKDGVTILKQIRGEWGRLSNSAKQDVMNKLGIRLPAVKRYLDASAAEMADVNAHAAKMPIITEKAIRTQQRFQKSLAVVHASFLQIGAVILEALEKPLQYVSKAAKWLSQQSEEVRGAIVGIVASLGMIAPILKAAQFLFGGLWKTFKTFIVIGVGGLKLIGDLLVFALARVIQLITFLAANPLVALFAAIAVMAYLIYANWDKIKAYFGQFMTWIANQAAKLGGIFEGLFHNLVEWIKNILSKIPVIGKMINDELKDQEADVELKQGYQNSVLGRNPPQMSMIPRGGMIGGDTTTNNNQKSSVTNTYNVTFNGVSEAEEINNKFTQVVRQSTTGVR